MKYEINICIMTVAQGTFGSPILNLNMIGYKAEWDIIAGLAMN